MRQAVFLDRDGTIIEDRGYIDDGKDIVFLPGVFEALRKLQTLFRLFIVTNQSGVGLGRISRESAENVNALVVKQLAGEEITICRVYTCFHARRDGCGCIKPNPHFLLEASREFDIRLRGSFAVGDHPHDAECARNAGATGLYVLTGHGGKHLEHLSADIPVFPDLAGAANWIMSRNRDETESEQQLV